MHAGRLADGQRDEVGEESQSRGRCRPRPGGRGAFIASGFDNPYKLRHDYRLAPLRDRPDFEAMVRDAVLDVVRRQVVAGLDVVTDGEQGKVSFLTYVKERLAGFDQVDVAWRAFAAARPALERHGSAWAGQAADLGDVAVRALERGGLVQREARAENADLDRQTREEFNKFQEGCVEENTNTASLVRRLLSDDYADKVIVTTIQKLGLALDENSKRNKQRSKNGQATYKEQLEALTDKRIVFIFDECHRSQFGDNHQTIKEFFPKADVVTTPAVLGKLAPRVAFLLSLLLASLPVLALAAFFGGVALRNSQFRISALRSETSDGSRVGSQSKTISRIG